MGGLVKSIFGGTDRSAQRQQVQTNTQNQALFQRLADQSGQTAREQFGAADTNRNMALSQILQLLGGTIPQQLQAQQQGNLGAQQQLIGGLPMVQAALLGQPVNMGALKPTQINYNTDWARQALPQFQRPQQPAAPTQPDLSSLLGGNFNV